MSDQMIPIPYKNLLNKILLEYKECSTIFGIHKSHFQKYENNSKLNFFGQECDSPIGPAAGPHTQMTQNIISAFLCGARFFELKTVQVLDKLEIEKPCILIKNEGYNTEWSQELSLNESYEEYLKAWFALHLINKIIFKKEIPGNFVFNMSVGYDLKGIKSEPVDLFINKMLKIDKTKFDEYFSLTKDFIMGIDESIFGLSAYEKNEIIEDLENIPRKISDSVTLSTMHGCPPDEIENIAEYLITEKKLHTFIKLNPTLLGYETVSKIVSDNSYKKIELREESFTHDLQFNDAVKLIKKLSRIAEKEKILFGLKLSNTLPVKTHPGSLPGDEMYLSGKVLFPITITLADKITDQIGSSLPISFSGGADANNVKEILSCGIKPVTFATDLLKPGGYSRLNQICQNAAGTIIPEKIEKSKLSKLSEDSKNSEYYKFNELIEEGVSINKKLQMFDCYVAPCKMSCPIGQDIPTYLSYCDESDYNTAAKVILDKNPLPHITSYICDHQCQFNCTRVEYDMPVEIRKFKKIAVENAPKIELNKKQLMKNFKVAVIGAGPAGLSLAYYLAREGIKVEIFEKEKHAGGVVKNFIPQFRIPADIIEKDLELLNSLGVIFHFNSEVDSIDQLFSDGFKYCFVGIGAQKSNEIPLEKSDNQQLHALDVLWQLKNEPGKCDLKGKVAVIGGGNSAMDCARAVKRLPSVEEVSIIYRRTEEQMPADKEEFFGALKDGVKFMPLLLPVSFINGYVKCRKTEVGSKFINGRPEIIYTDKFIELEFDHLISAVGEHADLNFFDSNKIDLDKNQNPIVNGETNESCRENVFIGGDCLIGPRTVVEAAGDAQIAAQEIFSREDIKSQQLTTDTLSKKDRIATEEIIKQRGKIYNNLEEFKESRCLNCDIICNKCVEVCPNRANISLPLDSDQFKDFNQIIHIDALCNECGNCTQFCPYDGDPYKDKFTIFNTEIDFVNNQNDGIVKLNGDFKLKFENEIFEFNSNNLENLNLPDSIKVVTKAVLNAKYLI